MSGSSLTFGLGSWTFLTNSVHSGEFWNCFFVTLALLPFTSLNSMGKAKPQFSGFETTDQLEYLASPAARSLWSRPLKGLYWWSPFCVTVKVLPSALIVIVKPSWSGAW